VVAEACFSAGFPMGAQADLVIHEGAKGNVRGYWEHAGVLELDRKIMKHNNAAWDVPPASVPLQMDDVLRGEMSALVSELPDGFCCKGPRLVWTVDLWSEFFSDVTLIAVFRNPAGFRRSVAHVWPERFSANSEARESAELNIWEAANRRLLELSRRFPCYWICFDDDIPVLKRRLEEVIGALGRAFDPNAFDAFFAPEERRFSSATDLEESGHGLPERTIALYQELRTVAGATDGSEKTPAPRDRVSSNPKLLYLDLLKGCLTRTLFPDDSINPGFAPTVGEFARYKRLDGRDWPSQAETMIGLKRLDNIQFCVTEALRDGVPGDLVEAGVWRGGAAIFMRAVLAAYGDTTRRVWLADSFQGLPQPDPDTFPLDEGDRHWELTPLFGIPLDIVRSNFERYGLLDEQVAFLPGWFKDTLPAAPIQAIAVLRVDAEMYQSTYEALTYFYPKVSRGGYVIVDDYGALPSCQAAVTDYRRMHGIEAEIQQIDWSGAYWRKA
jgi:O-methyltransferase